MHLVLAQHCIDLSILDPFMNSLVIYNEMLEGEHQRQRTGSNMARVHPSVTAFCIVQMGKYEVYSLLKSSNMAKKFQKEPIPLGNDEQTSPAFEYTPAPLPSSFLHKYSIYGVTQGAAIVRFIDDLDFFFMSLRMGGVALDLIIAAHAYIILDDSLCALWLASFKRCLSRLIKNLSSSTKDGYDSTSTPSSTDHTLPFVEAFP
ncbi:hypothetical protein VNO77_14573 [Canavalia gladiata]|uniref:Uncharacterized protein n=1 Tax=Canavalia gladiata TaxID=3824 RepID=A0AAN9QVH2_CANGL